LPFTEPFKRIFTLGDGSSSSQLSAGRFPQEFAGV
jgi:hypothetical protein